MKVVFSRNKKKDINDAIGSLMAYSDYLTVKASKSPFNLIVDTIKKAMWVKRIYCMNYDGSAFYDYNPDFYLPYDEMCKKMGFNPHKEAGDKICKNLLIGSISVFIIVGSIAIALDRESVAFNYMLIIEILAALVGISTLIISVIWEYIAEKMLYSDKRCYSMISELDEKIKKLMDISKLVGLSNYMENEYAVSNGGISINIDDNNKIEIKTSELQMELNEISSRSRSERTKTQRLTDEAIEKIFHDGVIDFSWLDGETNRLFIEVKDIVDESHREILALTDNSMNEPNVVEI